jgi:hypothetical protein
MGESPVDRGLSGPRAWRHIRRAWLKFGLRTSFQELLAERAGRLGTGSLSPNQLASA